MRSTVKIRPYFSTGEKWLIKKIIIKLIIGFQIRNEALYKTTTTTTEAPLRRRRPGNRNHRPRPRPIYDDYYDYDYQYDDVPGDSDDDVSPFFTFFFGKVSGFFCFARVLQESKNGLKNFFFLSIESWSELV